jgi:cation diffusion facilitator family transporter
MLTFISRRPQQLTLASTLIDLALVAAKLTLGLLTGSLALVSDAVHSGLDVIASLIAYAAVRTAAQPPDQSHPYGHGKAENMAAYTEGLLLVIAAAVILYEAAQRFQHPGPVDATPLALGFLVMAVMLEVVRSSVLRFAARRTGSASLDALAADKLADLLSVTSVLAGLLAVHFGIALGDTLAALVVVGLILWAAGHLVRRSLDVLMDRSVGTAEEKVLEAAAGVAGVREARSARVRQSGASLIGEVEVTGRPTLALEAADGLAAAVRKAVKAQLPEIELTVFVGSGSDPTQLVERVHAAAARNGRFKDLHDVLVEREADDRLHLSLHAKLPPATSMREATRDAHALEEDLRRELPELQRIDIHLEPLEPDVVHGRDVTTEHADLVRRIEAAAASDPSVASCQEVELSSRAGAITAYVLVKVADDLTLEQAHDIETALEDRIKRTERKVRHVVVRAQA